MPPGVRINSEEEIVLLGLELDDTIEIGGLEGAVKDDFLVGVEGGVHSLESAIIEASFVEVIGP